MSDLKRKWGDPPKPTPARTPKKMPEKKRDKYSYLEIKTRKLDGSNFKDICVYYLYDSRRERTLSPESLLKDDITKYRKRYIKNNLGDKTYEI